jgi:hypothetical protein
VSKIKTAGELRGFLADILVSIRNGSVDVEEAKAVAQVAAQINNSLAVEVKAAGELKKWPGDTAHIAGSMQIASGDVASIPDADQHRWCDQCEATVTAAEAASCKSPYCKAKAAA